jgi:hypothetical protein
MPRTTPSLNLKDEDIKVAKTAKKKAVRKKVRRSDSEITGAILKRAIDLRTLNKLSCADIAKCITPAGRSKPFTQQAVDKALRKVLPQDVMTTEYYITENREKRLEVMQEKQSILLAGITKEKAEKESAKDCSQGAKMLNEMIRLEEGKSTKNIAMSFAQTVEQSYDDNGL